MQNNENSLKLKYIKNCIFKTDKPSNVPFLYQFD